MPSSEVSTEMCTACGGLTTRSYEGDTYCATCGHLLHPGADEAQPPEPVKRTVVERVEVDGIVLPCRHIAERPPDHGAIITCHCGQVWRVVPEHGASAWKATPQ